MLPWDIPSNRLDSLKEKTLRYRFSIIHVPGVRHRAADGISRHPTGAPEKLNLDGDVANIATGDTRSTTSSIQVHGIHTCPPTGPGVESSVNDITASAAGSTLSMGIQAITWESVQMATASDPDMNQLVTAIKSGMPEKRLDLPPPLREFHKFRHDLHTIDGVVLLKDRIFIPPSLRSTVL